MRYILSPLAVLFIILTPLHADEPQNAPFAVVELFSSEGCSSCPSADRLMSKLAVWARQNNKPVYPMIFHVDYWNNLGWRDVFSRAQYTERQDLYSRVFKDQGVYTPEMIVNGSDAFTGSNQQQLQQDLDRELSLPAAGDLEISLARSAGHVLVTYSAQGFSSGDVVNVALVERGLTTDVTAGENAGRRLHHDNVVKEFVTKPLANGPSQISVPLDKIQDPTQASVIVFIQNPQTMLIEAAKEEDLA